MLYIPWKKHNSLCVAPQAVAAVKPIFFFSNVFSKQKAEKTHI